MLNARHPDLRITKMRLIDLSPTQDRHFEAIKIMDRAAGIYISHNGNDYLLAMPATLLDPERLSKFYAQEFRPNAVGEFTSYIEHTFSSMFLLKQPCSVSKTIMVMRSQLLNRFWIPEPPLQQQLATGQNDTSITTCHLVASTMIDF